MNNMLGDNIIAYDCLESEKTSVKELTNAAIESENQNLKQTFLQMRNQAEQDQKNIYHIAEQNGWYLAASNANPQDVVRFRNFFQQTYLNPQSTSYQVTNYQTQVGTGQHYQTTGQAQGQTYQNQGYRNRQGRDQYQYGISGNSSHYTNY